MIREHIKIIIFTALIIGVGIIGGVIIKKHPKYYPDPKSEPIVLKLAEPSNYIPDRVYYTSDIILQNGDKELLITKDSVYWNGKPLIKDSAFVNTLKKFLHHETR